MQTLMGTMDSIQPHQIALKSRVVLERPEAHMSIQYLCGTSRPDTSYIIHVVSEEMEIEKCNACEFRSITAR